MRIGAQLYTVRDFTKNRTGFVESLDRLVDMGYEGVQLSAVGCMEGDEPQVSVVEAAELLAERGLVCAATHRSWERLSGDLESEILAHRALGCGYCAIGMAPGGVHAKGLEGYRGWLAEAECMSSRMSDQGIRFGYHNHALEFERMDGGVRPYDVMVGEADWLQLELDTYWVHHGGMDVVDLIERLSGRLEVVHVKDVGVHGFETTFEAVGEGNLDWDKILSAFEGAGTEWVLVEQDVCRRDPFDCLASSARYLQGHLV